jgi:precorrin-6B methylase 2
LLSVAIVGGAESTAFFAPFDDPNWQIWGLAWHTTGLKRLSLLFDIHDPGFKAEAPYRYHFNSHRNQKYIDKINTSGIPIVCDERALGTFQNGFPYPLEEITASMPKRDFLECTISYMVAYALHKGAKRIGLWGCHFTGKDEYQYQLPSLTWLLGYAEAKGVEIIIGPGGPLLVSGYNAGRYGVDHDTRPRSAGPTDWAKVSMSIEINNQPVRFSVPNERAAFRVDTIETKEPKTVEWIRNIPAKGVVWDIGANIGIYSAYAAAYGHDVVAVEADEGHCSALARTVALSDFDNIRVINTALNKRMTIDELVKNHGFKPPTHIKIDTDGDDLMVVQGAKNSLSGVQSVIVETDDRNEADKQQIDSLLSGAGFMKTGRHVIPNNPQSPVGMDHWHRS